MSSPEASPAQSAEANQKEEKEDKQDAYRRSRSYSGHRLAQMRVDPQGCAPAVKKAEEEVAALGSGYHPTHIDLLKLALKKIQDKLREVEQTPAADKRALEKRLTSLNNQCTKLSDFVEVVKTQKLAFDAAAFLRYQSARGIWKKIGNDKYKVDYTTLEKAFRSTYEKLPSKYLAYLRGLGSNDGTVTLFDFALYSDLNGPLCSLLLSAQPMLIPSKGTKPQILARTVQFEGMTESDVDGPAYAVYQPAHTGLRKWAPALKGQSLIAEFWDDVALESIPRPPGDKRVITRATVTVDELFVAAFSKDEAKAWIPLLEKAASEVKEQIPHEAADTHVLKDQLSRLESRLSSLIRWSKGEQDKSKFRLSKLLFGSKETADLTANDFEEDPFAGQKEAKGGGQNPLHTGNKPANANLRPVAIPTEGSMGDFNSPLYSPKHKEEGGKP